MKRLIGIVLVALLIPAPVAQADYKPNPYKPSPTHTIKVKTSQHIYCPYKGCTRKFH